MIIAPSILSADFFELGKELSRIESAEWIHVDAMDGHFVPNLTFGAMIVEAIRPHTDRFIDCHLMVENPEKMIASFSEAGADMITVQAESTPHLHRTIQSIQDQGVKAGLALNPGTSVESVLPLLSMVDMVLVMTVNPGFGGQAFIPEMLDKIGKLNILREQEDHDYLIQVDGGINAETAKECLDRGADVLVAGSYIFNAEDPSTQIKKLKTINE